LPHEKEFSHSPVEHWLEMRQEKKVDTLTKYLAVAGGGAVGAVLRYYITLSGLSRTVQPFPTATFVINITGSFIIGFFLTLVTERIPINPHVRLAVAVGFVGAYTTFSTFEYETARLVEGRDFLYAFLYVVLSFAVGFGAVWGGIVAARKIERVPTASHVSVYGNGEVQELPTNGRGSESAGQIVAESSQRRGRDKN
jgi:CrcB protein